MENTGNRLESNPLRVLLTSREDYRAAPGETAMGISKPAGPAPDVWLQVAKGTLFAICGWDIPPLKICKNFDEETLANYGNVWYS